MVKSNNYIPRIAYLRKPQHEALESIRDTIKKEYGISIPIAEIVRDGIDSFLKNQGSNLEEYVKSKGF